MLLIFLILFVSVATLRHHPRLSVRRGESDVYFCNSICVSCYFTPPSPFERQGVEKVHSIFVILFVSVVTLRHHPRLGVGRRECAFYFCNSICVSCYFTPPSPFGRQA